MMVEAKVIRGRWWTGRIAGQRGIVGCRLPRVEYSAFGKSCHASKFVFKIENN